MDKNIVCSILREIADDIEETNIQDVALEVTREGTAYIEYATVNGLTVYVRLTEE